MHQGKENFLFRNYAKLILSLLLYSLLPQYYLHVVFTVFRSISAVWLSRYYLSDDIKETMQTYSSYFPFSIFKWFFNLLRGYGLNAIEVLLAFQSNLQELKNRWIGTDERMKIIISFLVLLLPSGLVSTSQLLACHVMSLATYQLATIYANHGANEYAERSSPLPFSPEKDNEVFVNKISKVQMKLITMLLVGAFVSLSYYQVVIVFLMGSALAPFVALCVHHAVRYIHTHTIEKFYPQGVLQKNFEATIISVALMVLLLNYKYEQHIVNFVATFYSSILIGDISRHFYKGITDDELVTSADEMIKTLYHPEIVFSFWIVSFFYEVTAFYTMPHIIFIVLGMLLGTQFNPIVMIRDYIVARGGELSSLIVSSSKSSRVRSNQLDQTKTVLFRDNDDLGATQQKGCDQTVNSAGSVDHVVQVVV